MKKLKEAIASVKMTERYEHGVEKFQSDSGDATLKRIGRRAELDVKFGMSLQEGLIPDNYKEVIQVMLDGMEKDFTQAVEKFM